MDGCCLKKLDGTGRFEVVVLKKLAEKGLLGAGHGRAIRARRTKESILGPAESCLGEVQPSVTKAWFLCGDQERLPLSMRYEGKRRRPVILTGYFVQSTAPQRSQIMNDALLSDCWKEPRCRYRDSIDVATVKDAEVIAQPRPGVELALPLPPTACIKNNPTSTVSLHTQPAHKPCTILRTSSSLGAYRTRHNILLLRETHPATATESPLGHDQRRHPTSCSTALLQRE